MQKKQNKALIVFFSLVIAAAVAYLLWSDSKVSAQTANSILTPRLMQSITDAKFDFSFLKEPKFLSLVKYGESPVVAGQIGRTHPFEPF